MRILKAHYPFRVGLYTLSFSQWSSIAIPLISFASIEMFSEVRFAFVVLSSVLVHLILADVTYISFTKNVITDCPTKSRTPPPEWRTIDKPVELRVDQSTNGYWDTSIVIFSNIFTIHRLQSFMTKCTYNITYIWDDFQSQFMARPTPGIDNHSHPIFVYWNDDLTVAALYDCRPTDRSFAVYVRDDPGNLNASFQKFAEYGMTVPVIEPLSKSDHLIDLTATQEQCENFAKNRPPTRYPGMIQTIVVIVVLVVLCVLCIVIF